MPIGGARDPRVGNGRYLSPVFSAASRGAASPFPRRSCDLTAARRRDGLFGPARGTSQGAATVIKSKASVATVATTSASPREDGAYLTDGQRLFRVVCPLCSRNRPDMAILEDCGTLCLTAFTSSELSTMRLIRVTPTSL